MRSPERWAVAIRRPDGSVHTELHPVNESRSGRRLGFARALVALAQAVSIGMRGIRVALRETVGVEPSPRQITSTLAAAGGGALVIFIIVPAVFAAAWTDRIADVGEAAGRAAVLLVYLLVVARSDAARRLFGYHGAEHKVIAAYESLGELPPLGEARSASAIHPRCGTSFIALFVIVAGIVHALVPRLPLWQGALWRVALTPVDAVLAYEVMRAAAREPRALWARVVTWPGRALQRITTQEPSDEQLEVAMAALGSLAGRP